VTVTELDTGTQALLDRAASLLDAIGAAPAGSVPSDVVVRCLFAAESLERAGGRATPAHLVDGDPATTIRAAMTALSQLHFDTFRGAAVLAAARAARRALQRLG